MTDEAGLLATGWKFLVTAGGGVLSFLAVRAVKRLDDMQANMDAARQELHAHKMHVAEQYILKSDVLAAVLDLKNDINELRSDVKTLIGRK